ncbi:hypothetical protein AAFF_G00132840 [Aldrovandia affinis]|uniref:Uncharacterized protein n=1 Tax=Aldrovandia affinis TaxID=143900 RepID=A0AAD7RQV3_9TELE|nr:hypothetical protein AAFF_G00132840 [Aldrovandia affinis]
MRATHLLCICAHRSDNSTPERTKHIQRVVSSSGLLKRALEQANTRGERFLSLSLRSSPGPGVGDPTHFGVKRAPPLTRIIDVDLAQDRTPHRQRLPELCCTEQQVGIWARFPLPSHRTPRIAPAGPMTGACTRSLSFLSPFWETKPKKHQRQALGSSAQTDASRPGA